MTVHYDLNGLDLTGDIRTPPLKHWLNSLPGFTAEVHLEAGTTYEFAGTTYEFSGIIRWHSFKRRPGKTQRLKRMHQLYAARRHMQAS